MYVDYTSLDYLSPHCFATSSVTGNDAIIFSAGLFFRGFNPWGERGRPASPPVDAI